MKLPGAGLKVCVNNRGSSAHAQEGEDNQDDDDETDDIDDTIHGMFLVNGAVTAFYKNGTITHHGANSDAKEQVPSATLLAQVSLTTKTQRGSQNAILVNIGHILQLQPPPPEIALPTFREHGCEGPVARR